MYSQLVEMAIGKLKLFSVRKWFQLKYDFDNRITRKYLTYLPT